MDQGALPLIDELNAAVQAAQALPRVRFESNLGEVAENWIRKKHAGGTVHEPATLAAFLAIRNRYQCRSIYDVGALFGYFSLLSQGLFPGAEITAFEMHPGAIDTLRTNVGPTITCVHAAVSDKAEKAVMFWLSGFNIYEKPEAGWDALEAVPGALKERGFQNRGRGFATVDFLTLDDYSAAHKPPDLIKIDVEGYQAKAIRGAQELLRTARPAVIIELHDPPKLERFGITNKTTVQPLFDAGYRGFWCGNHRDKDAVFEPLADMDARHEKLSLAVFVPK